MIACCNPPGGQTYINEDGTLFPGYLEKHFPTGTRLVKIQDSTTAWARRVFKQTGEFPAPEKAVDLEGNIHEICLCSCHRVGTCMMH